ncbi:MAG: hypothetical protein M3Z21_02460 [Pseudomonadota bacterium]|nr:hypothetical protein [Pseudomonadota bacterium]
MTAVKVQAGRGPGWLVDGWRLFLRAPWPWLGMFLVYFVIDLLLSVVPLLGLMASALLTPVLIGGMVYGAAQLDGGGRLEFSHLFRGFQDQDKTGPLLLLGLIFVAITAAGWLLIGLTFAGGMAAMPMHGAGHGEMPMMPPVGPLTPLVALLVGLATFMAMFYAIPLVMLGGMAPVRAVRESFAAALTNILPLLLFCLIELVLVFVAMMPFGLGLLVVGPVTVAAVYASYREVFPAQPPPLPAAPF